MTFSPVIVGSGFTAFQNLQRTRDTQIETLKASPDVARDVAYFKENIQKIGSTDELLEDRRLLRVALGAFGLEEDIDNRGFLRTVLDSNLNDSSSAANRLSDRRYFEFARAFNFSGGQPQVPGTNPALDIQNALQTLESVDDLFDFRNEGLLDRTLETFGLTGSKDRTEMLKRVLTSNLEDPSSIANRLSDSNYAAMARAFQGKTIPLPAEFLNRFDSDTAQQLQSIGTPDGLVNEPVLLRTVLNAFDLSSSRYSDTVLRTALASDPNDPTSFVNQFGDSKLTELVETFDFFARTTAPVTIYDFANRFDGQLETLQSADDLLDNDGLLQTALKVFGLGSAEPDKAFLQRVLESDLTDPASTANRQTDERYAAFASAFGFGAIATGTEQAEAQRRTQFLIDTVNERRTTPATTPDAFLQDLSLVLATSRFFGLSDSVVGETTLSRVVRSDPTSDLSVLNVVSDERYQSFYNALGLAQGSSRVYPAGFADALSNEFLEREFEVRVGEVDQNMRIAISLEREIGGVLERSQSNNARWFGVMASPPLRSAFEAALNLPTELGSVDLQQQLTVFTERAESLFGTSDLSELGRGDLFQDLQERYLRGLELQGATQAASSDGPYSSALAILRGG